MSVAPGIGGWDSLFTYTEAEQKALMDDYNKRFSQTDQETPSYPGYIIYRAPDGRIMPQTITLPTLWNRYVPVNLLRQEDAVFGFRAAARMPVHVIRDSYFQNQRLFTRWLPGMHLCPENRMKIVG
jgi:hypothetical protein